ncbi:hypothetical protein F4778DRAFT_783479 [Xylariomycetidae sp. FL2044]|nr:hypothetical protein F4778DRAFT_783479 [Xylariomycetidae sp. FL2044]
MSAPEPTGPAGELFANRGGEVIASCVVFAVMCTTVLILRFASLRIGHRPVNPEDLIMIPAWVLMMGLIANVIFSVKSGAVGRHEAYVLQYEPRALISWAKALFITEILYGILIPMEKTSILLLYLRLFYIHRWFRFVTFGMMAYIWIWGICEALVGTFQCTPIEYQWNRQIEGHCFDQLAYFHWHAIPNIIHDVVMLIVPAPVVWKLQITVRQKIALSSVFLIGSIGCLAGFIRFYLFWEINAFTDRTWASIQLMSWTLAEPGIIYICACMPSLWPIIIRVVPAFRKVIATYRQKSSRTRSSTRPQDGGFWDSRRHSRIPVSTDNDFIPLRDIEDRSGQNDQGDTSNNDGGRAAAGGIHVATEFTWTAVEHSTGPK